MPKDFPGNSELSPEWMDLLLDRATDHIFELFLEPLARRMLTPEGRAFGEIALTDPNERILRTIDDHQTGMLDALGATPESQPEFDRVRRQFDRDLNATAFPIPTEPETET